MCNILFLPPVYGRRLPLILGKTEAGKTHTSAELEDLHTVPGRQDYSPEVPQRSSQLETTSLSGNQKSKHSKAAGKSVRNSHLERAWNKGQNDLGGGLLERLPTSESANTTVWGPQGISLNVWMTGCTSQLPGGGSGGLCPLALW